MPDCSSGLVYFVRVFGRVTHQLISDQNLTSYYGPQTNVSAPVFVWPDLWVSLPLFLTMLIHIFACAVEVLLLFDLYLM